MDEDDSLTFPDPERAELDRTLARLVDQASQVLKTQGRLRALIKANRAVTEGLELSSVLRRIVDAAVELVDAEYGAMGVIAPHGGLEQFIHVGMSPELARRIGHLPEGHGILGAVIDEAEPIRLERLSDDHRSVGFPADHPPMSSFLGVPVHVRDEVFGNLYLTNKHDGPFTAEDEHLVTALASTAGFAIENARLFEETKSRQAWTAASMELTAAMLGATSVEANSLLADASLQLASASTASVLGSRDTAKRWRIVASRRRDSNVPLPLLTDRIAMLADEALSAGGNGIVGEDEASGRHLLAVPVPLPDPRILLLGRDARSPRFTAFEVRMASALCAQAALAIELVGVREVQEEMLLLEDRGRIARDLHDHVIQRLFGTGLALQGVAGTLPDPASRIVGSAIDSLDASIAQIRTVVFALSGAPPSPNSLRQRIVALADESRHSLAYLPVVTFAGPIDHTVTAAQADEVLAVCREAVSNTARHANATETSVHLSVADASLTLVVMDDGIGFDASAPHHASGITNLRERAERLGGSCTITSSHVGTSVEWSIPLEAVDEAPDHLEGTT